MPIAQASQARTKDVTAYRPAPAERPRILVVDDDPINRLVARILIEARGYEVIEAEDGEAALAAYAETSDIGLVLMDLAMPGMDGLTAARNLRSTSRRGATVPIVALTRHIDDNSRRNCFDAGIIGFLPKPISAAGIESIVCLVGHGAYRAHHA